MPATLPYRFSPEEVADAVKLMADLDALTAMFGAIKDADCSALMDLDGNKLSPTPGKQIPTAAIANSAVTSTKIAADAASPGSDANRAVSGDAIKVVTAAQLARILPTVSGTPKTGGIALDKLDLTVYTQAVGATAGPFGILITPATAFPVATYLCTAVYIKLLTPNLTSSVPSIVPLDSGANWTFNVTLAASTTVAFTFVAIFAKLVTP